MRPASFRLVVCAAVLLGIAHAAAAQDARIGLVPSDTKDPIVGPIFEGIKSRGGQPLNMHRSVANSPKIFKAYVDMAITLRTAATTPRVDRELIILRAAQLAGGDYEFAQHRPMGLSCGLTPAQVDGLENWRKRTDFTERQRAILGYADGMAAEKGVDDRTFGELKKHFNDQEIVELTVTAAFYGMVSQITRSLAVKLEPNAGQTAYGAC